MTDPISGARRRSDLDDAPDHTAPSPPKHLPWVVNDRFGSSSFPAELFTGMAVDPSWTGSKPVATLPVVSATAPASSTKLVATIGNAHVFADRGIPLDIALKDAALGTAGQLERFIDEYTAYTQGKPALAKLYAGALKTGPEILARRLDLDDAEAAKRAEQQLRDQRMADQLAPLQIRPPIPIQQRAAVGEVAIPVARTVVTVAKLVPAVGELVILAEVASGRSIAGLGEKLDKTERAVDAMLLIAPFAALALKTGARGAAELLRLSRATGRSIEETRSFCNLAVDVSANQKVIKEEIATTRTRWLMHEPEVVADPNLPAGDGLTTIYGDVTFSPHGTPEQVALAKAHEKVHSYLTPKALNGLYQFRAEFGHLAYEKSALCRYLEEALAESYAQVTVNGWSSLPKGITFPIRNGYVTLKEVAVETAVTIIVGDRIYEVTIGDDKQ